MRKVGMTLGLMAVLVALTWGTARAEVSVESLTWFDYLANFDNNFTLSQGNFFIERGYLTLKGDIGDKFSGRVTLDIAKKGEELFKYAYIDYKASKALVLSAGMIKTYFGYMALWEYPLPTKDICDLYKIHSSVDLGLMVSGQVSILQYNVQLLNGEGYANWEKGDSDDKFCGIANVVITPLEKKEGDETNQKTVMKMDIGVSYKYAGATTTFDHGIAAYVDFTAKGFNAVVEYAGKFGGSSTGNYLSLDLGYGFSKQFKALGKFVMDLSADPSIYLGANIIPVKGFIIKPMIGVDLGTTMDYVFMTQLEYKIGFKVK